MIQLSIQSLAGVAPAVRAAGPPVAASGAFALALLDVAGVAVAAPPRQDAAGTGKDLPVAADDTGSIPALPVRAERVEAPLSDPQAATSRHEVRRFDTLSPNGPGSTQRAPAAATVVPAPVILATPDTVPRDDNEDAVTNASDDEAPAPPDPPVLPEPPRPALAIVTPPAAPAGSEQAPAAAPPPAPAVAAWPLAPLPAGALPRAPAAPPAVSAPGVARRRPDASVITAPSAMPPLDPLPNSVPPPPVASIATAVREPVIVAPPPVAPPLAARPEILTPQVQPAAQAFAMAIFAAAQPIDRPVEQTPADPPLAAISSAMAMPAPSVVTPPPVLDTARGDWIATMIDHIEVLRDGAAVPHETRLRLAPEVLGNLEVAVRRDEAGAIQVRIAADTPQARILLADAAPKLAELAEARGIKLGGATVDAGGAGFADHRHAAPAVPPPARRRARVAAADIVTDSRLA